MVDLDRSQSVLLWLHIVPQGVRAVRHISLSLCCTVLWHLAPAIDGLSLAVFALQAQFGSPEWLQKPVFVQSFEQVSLW